MQAQPRLGRKRLTENVPPYEGLGFSDTLRRAPFSWSLAMPDDAALTAVMNGYWLIFRTLIKHLDAKGQLSATELAEDLLRQADEIAESWAPAYVPGTPRLDVSVLRTLAQSLRGEAKPGVSFGYGQSSPAEPANDLGPERPVP